MLPVIGGELVDGELVDGELVDGELVGGELADGESAFYDPPVTGNHDLIIIVPGFALCEVKRVRLAVNLPQPFRYSFSRGKREIFEGTILHAKEPKVVHQRTKGRMPKTKGCILKNQRLYAGNGLKHLF